MMIGLNRFSGLLMRNFTIKYNYYEWQTSENFAILHAKQKQRMSLEILTIQEVEQLWQEKKNKLNTALAFAFTRYFETLLLRAYLGRINQIIKYSTESYYA